MITALRPEHIEAIAKKIQLKYELLYKQAHLYSEERVILTDDQFSSKDGNIKTRELLLIGFLYCKNDEGFDAKDEKIQNLWYLVNPGCSQKVPIAYVQHLLKDMLYIAVTQRLKVIEEYEDDNDHVDEGKTREIEKENLKKFKYLQSLEDEIEDYKNDFDRDIDEQIKGTRTDNNDVERHLSF